MADSNIGSLPQAVSLDDDSLLVAEQQGEAVKVTGAQFKEFGRQAVIGQVQGYVDQAEAAANRATDAVSAVTDMTVEASTLAAGQNATVTKTTKNGKVNLLFGLPRGEQGVQGPAGPEGPRGPKGEAGAGLDIVGRYDTTQDVPDPQEGKSYYIGTQAPYDLYTYIDGEWVNNGPISGGGGGGPLPENVVTAEGGASVTFPVVLGDGPHTITFVNEEEPPLTAEDVQYSDTQTVKQALDGLKSSVSNGKALIASAITDKGVETAQDATFAQMAENIGEISTGSDTSDATATSFDILSPKTAYTAAGKVEGAIPTLLRQTIVPGTADKTIANGQYLGGTQVIKGDQNLTSGNIKKGVSIFGVAGAMESSFKATLTVTADTGAVVTAKHTDGTEVSALSQTGTVVLDLPKEGTWKVTAVRGVAQYNTVTLEVSSSYSAELTAEVHIERYGAATSLPYAGNKLAATTVQNYAIFAGGDTHSSQPNYGGKSATAYDGNLTQSALTDLTRPVLELCGAAVNAYAFFAGGYNGFYVDHTPYYSEVNAYDFNLTKVSVSDLSKARSRMAGTSINGYALFCGGYDGQTSQSIVDCYNFGGAKESVLGLSLPVYYAAAASKGDYAIICGDESATAYNKELSKQTITKLSSPRYGLSAAAAGNYILFAGGYTSSVVDAYDLFLTRITAEGLSVPRGFLAGTTLEGYAIFVGGMQGAYPRNHVDVYDSLLVKTSPSALESAKAYLASANAGNYALFGGGQYDSATPGNYYSSTVEVYQYV